jgi:hypothetical protein
MGGVLESVNVQTFKRSASKPYYVSLNEKVLLVAGLFLEWESSY